MSILPVGRTTLRRDGRAQGSARDSNILPFF
uniref:Uncharacterized protein n=1 Tax=Setaria viridis TaxID=4556 RepID=A0A4U6TTN1_SETVI|nr:hypothetical protein SEVIR_7G240250v2 [Setaria viridis]